MVLEIFLELDGGVKFGFGTWGTGGAAQGIGEELEVLVVDKAIAGAAATGREAFCPVRVRDVRAWLVGLWEA
jgi:hypothetical protein